MSGDRESMVVCRHEDGTLEIVSQGTETQLISRDLLVEVVASLNQNLAEIERLRAEVLRKHDYGCRMDALAEERLMEITRLWLAGAALAEVALYARSWITPVAAMNFRDRLDAALAAWQEARRER